MVLGTVTFAAIGLAMAGALRAELFPNAPVPIIPPEVPVGLPSALLERRPDIRQAEAQIAAATARIGEAKAEWFPRVTLLGTAGRQASQLHEITLGMGNFFAAGPAVSLPIFTGGRIRSNIRVQDARLQQAVIGYRSTVLSALEETENSLVSYSQEQVRRERADGVAVVRPGWPEPDQQRHARHQQEGAEKHPDQRESSTCDHEETYSGSAPGPPGGAENHPKTLEVWVLARA